MHSVTHIHQLGLIRCQLILLRLLVGHPGCWHAEAEAVVLAHAGAQSSCGAAEDCLHVGLPCDTCCLEEDGEWFAGGGTLQRTRPKLGVFTDLVACRAPQRSDSAELQCRADC